MENHPPITFRSKRIEGAALRPGARFHVLGDLTIRGTSVEVPLDVTFHGTTKDPWGGMRAGFEATAVIDLRTWGLTGNQALETAGLLVGNDIRVDLHVQAVQQVHEAVAAYVEDAVAA